MDNEAEDCVLTVEHFKRTLDIQKAQAMEVLNDCHEEPEEVFCGLIIEKIDDDDIEKDGGHGSKLKIPAIPRSTVIKKPKEMRLIETKSESAVEFYHMEKIMEATDDGGVVIKVLYHGIPNQAKFIKCLRKDGETGKLHNLDGKYICLSPGEKPILLSLSEGDIKARGKNVVSLISIFQTQVVKDESPNITIFFSVKENRKQFNYYLKPTCSSDEVGLAREDATGLDKHAESDLHRKYLAFRYEPTPSNTSGEIDDIDFHEATLSPETPHSKLDTESQISADSITPPTIIPIVESEPLPQKNGDAPHLSTNTSDSGISTGSIPSDTSLDTLSLK